MSRSSKKKAEYDAMVEANLSRMYQEYLDLMSEKMGRKLTKEDLDTQEKRDRLSQEWKTRDLGRLGILENRPMQRRPLPEMEKASGLRRSGKSDVFVRPALTTSRFQTRRPMAL